MKIFQLLISSLVVVPLILGEKDFTLKLKGEKTLLISDDDIFIGATNKLYIQDAENISKTKKEISWEPSSSAFNQCNKLPIKKSNCYNYIQTVLSYNSTHLFLCGTNAAEIRNAFYNIEKETITIEDSDVGIMCSWRHFEKVTSQITLQKNRTVIIGTQHYFGFNYDIKIIKRLQNGDLVQTKHSYFDQPKFVGSFTAVDVYKSDKFLKNYFVFDEDASEEGLTGRTTRIAQVCADDEGDGNGLWTSFLKSRLLCAYGERDLNLFFNLITDIEVVEEEFLFGTFITESKYQKVSAVCSFKISEIQKDFSKQKFLSQNLLTGDFSKITGPTFSKPFGSCVNLTTIKNSMDFVKFISNHPLKANAIKPYDKMSIFVMDEITFTSISAFTQTIENVTYNFFYIGTKCGKIIKLLQKTNRSLQKLFQIQISNETIESLKTSSNTESLYITTKSFVKQVSLYGCSNYLKQCDFCNKCLMCSLSGDPSCKWDEKSKKCLKTTIASKMPSVNEIENICENVKSDSQVIEVALGSSSIILGDSLLDTTITTRWSKSISSGKILYLNETVGKFEEDEKGRLIINNFSKSEDSATYNCEYSINNIIISQRSFKVISGRNLKIINGRNGNEPKSGTNAGLIAYSVIVTVLCLICVAYIIRQHHLLLVVHEVE